MPRKNVTDMDERCEAYVYDMYGRKIKGRCVNRRHIKINRKELCIRHAALEALDLAMKAGDAKRMAARHPALYGAVRTEYEEKGK